MKIRYKLSIGIVVVLALLAGLGLWARSGLRNFFYPVAPRMPADVAESMPEILSRLEHVLRTNAPHVLAALQPGLTEEEITRLESQNGVRVPQDIRAIYRWHNGSRRITDRVISDFIPIHRFLPLDEALAERAPATTTKATFFQRAASRVLAGHRDSWIALFNDGAGDGYWYDPQRTAAQGAVFYNFTETGSYVFFPSAKNLMAGIAKCYSEGVFRVKRGSSPPQLDEDFEKAQKLWTEFGASNPQ